jgi:nucleotide-binding universal stress UspA family protein
MNVIVVGVDGSEHAEAALEFAVEEAALRGARLHIVFAWNVPTTAALGILSSKLMRSFDDEAERIVRAAVARVRELQPACLCESRVVKGRPASVLLAEARGATLLVLGSPGRGDAAEMLLGSVSQQVLHHASCPVTMVPKTRTRLPVVSPSGESSPA